jgi:hypothetical protein
MVSGISTLILSMQRSFIQFYDPAEHKEIKEMIFGMTDADVL